MAYSRGIHKEWLGAAKEKGQDCLPLILPSTIEDPTELNRTEDCGQISVNISKPGITKGQHWHNRKWELFIVVSGYGLIQERNINTNETMEFEVSGPKIEPVYIIYGWTYNRPGDCDVGE